MVLAFYYRSPLWVLLFSQLAFWCDERAIINSSYIGLWFIWPTIQTWVKQQKINLKQIPISAFVLVGSVAIYAILRYWLTVNYGMKIGHDNSLSMKSIVWSLSIIGDKYTRGFEGLWFIIFAGIVAMILQKDWLKLSLFGVCLLITWWITAMVADGTRALSYSFIAFFIVLDYLKQYTPIHQIKILLILAALVSLMLPISFP